MCGRYTSTTPRDQLGKLFEALVTDRERDASYNVSPTSDVYVILDDGEARKVDLLRWGFVPSWSKDLKIGNPHSLHLSSGWSPRLSPSRDKESERFRRAARLIDSDPSMLGCSGHVIGAATVS